MLAKILKEGPTLGMHTIIWCDSYNNVARCFDRQVLRDFDSRIVFQMSPNDSSNLMDSPQASRLGDHRAYLYSDDRGEAEKFRPYGTPSLAWLTDMASRLGQSDKVSG